MLTKVPCGPCQACCKDQTIYLMPDIDDPTKYIVEEVYNPLTRTFGYALQQKPNGECVYLSEKGCGIHDRAPVICQTFDCRRFVRSLGDRSARRRALREKQLDPVIHDAAMARMHTLEDEGDLR